MDPKKNLSFSTVAKRPLGLAAPKIQRVGKVAKGTLTSAKIWVKGGGVTKAIMDVRTLAHSGGPLNLDPRNATDFPNDPIV